MSSVKNIVEETIKETVNNVCSNYSRQLSEWLQENKNVEISPEEICVAWDVPYRTPSTPGIPSGAAVRTQLPDYYSGTGTVSPAKKRGGRSKKVEDPSASKCQYKMTRGKNPGKCCDNAVLGDGTLGSEKYCKSCLKKAAVQKLLEKPDDKSTMQPPSIPGNSVKVPKETDIDKEEISVIEIEGKPGWFKEQKHGFIIEQKTDAVILAHEVEENGEVRKLNENDRKLALAIGFQVVNNDETEIYTDIPNIPIPN